MPRAKAILAHRWSGKPSQEIDDEIDTFDSKSRCSPLPIARLKKLYSWKSGFDILATLQTFAIFSTGKSTNNKMI